MEFLKFCQASLEYSAKYDKIWTVAGWEWKRCRFVTRLVWCSVLWGSLVTSTATLGGPYLPQSNTQIIPLANNHWISPQGSNPAHTAFEEISPLLEEVIIKKGDPFIEVFIRGSGLLDCYDVREFQVEKTATSTQIIPRLRRLNITQACKLGLKSFYDKAADLDPASPATQNIEVLGYRGWIKVKYKP